MFEILVVFLVPLFLVLLAATVLAHIFFRVPYVPSRKRVVKKMIEAANLKPKETVYDLGCGDGRLLIEAEKKAKIRGTGFEIAPLVYLLALAKKLLTKSKFSLRFQNFFTVNLKRADVIFCYLLPGALSKLALKIKKECRKDTRIISHTFHIPGLKPVKIIKKNLRTKTPTIYLYKI